MFITAIWKWTYSYAALDQVGTVNGIINYIILVKTSAPDVQYLFKMINNLNNKILRNQGKKLNPQLCRKGHKFSRQEGHENPACPLHTCARRTPERASWAAAETRKVLRIRPGKGLSCSWKRPKPLITKA